MLNHLAIREQEVRQLVLSQHTRVGFTIERCDVDRDQFLGEHWIVVLKKQSGTKTLFVYDLVTKQYYQGVTVFWRLSAQQERNMRTGW